MNHIPKRLRKEPLIEAIWQVQFDSPGAGEALPGLLYATLLKDHPNLQLIRLPIADIPASVAQMDPNLRLAAKIRLDEPGGVFLWQVGDRVATLNQIDVLHDHSKRLFFEHLLTAQAIEKLDPEY